MINKFNLINITLIFVFLFTFPNLNNAKEILIYADDISYDEDENIIAKGNAKIFQNNEFILSDLIIYEKLSNKIILPTEFTLKDKDNNYFKADSGFFEQNWNFRFSMAFLDRL